MFQSHMMPVRQVAQLVRRTAYLLWILTLYTALSSVFASPPAGASEHYEAVVGVADQGEEERYLGLRLALQSVLADLTEDPGVATRSEWADVLAQPAIYIEQYGYHLFSTKTDNIALAAMTTETPLYILKVRFAQAALETALRERGIAVRTVDHPEILLWLAVRGNQEHYILSTSSPVEILQPLQAQAHRHDIPMLLPLMDLQDQAAIAISDLRGGFNARIQQASDRYDIDAIVTGSLRQGESNWHCDWGLNYAGRTDSWQSSGKSLAEVVSAGINGLAKRLASPSFHGRGPVAVASIPIATVSSAPEIPSPGILLRIDQVHSLPDYARIIDYLSRLSILDNFQVAGSGPDTIYFWLNARGGFQALRSAMDASSKLSGVNSESSTLFRQAPQLRYALVR